MRAKRLSNVLVALVLLGGLALRPAVAGIDRFTAYGPPNSLILSAVALPGPPGGLLISTALGGVFRSADGGHTWAGSGLGLAGDVLRALAADPFQAGTLYGASETAFYRSADRGQSWTVVASGQKFGPDFNFALAIAPGERGQNPVFYLTAGPQLFVSHDLGATWPASLTEDSRSSFTALAIDPEHPRTTAYAAVQGIAGTVGLLRSTDTGFLWSRLTLPAAFIYGVVSFAIVPTSPPVYLASNLEGRLFRSITGGASWREVRAAGTRFSRLEADPRSPGTVYGFVGGSLRVSSDSGATWRSLGNPLDEDLQNLVFDPAKGRGTLYAFTLFDVFSGGAESTGAPRFARWSLLLHSAIVSDNSFNFAGRLRFDPTSRAIVYGILDNRVYQSTDGGASWASFAIDDSALPPDLYDLVLDPANPRHLLLSTVSDGLFESPDRGLTWTPVGAPHPPGSSTIRSGRSSPSTRALSSGPTAPGFCAAPTLAPPGPPSSAFPPTSSWSTRRTGVSSTPPRSRDRTRPPRRFSPRARMAARAGTRSSTTGPLRPSTPRLRPPSMLCRTARSLKPWTAAAPGPA